MDQLPREIQAEITRCLVALDDLKNAQLAGLWVDSAHYERVCIDENKARFGRCIRVLNMFVYVDTTLTPNNQSGVLMIKVPRYGIYSLVHYILRRELNTLSITRIIKSAEIAGIIREYIRWDFSRQMHRRVNYL